MIYENGIYTMSNNDYHNSSAISRSSLMIFNKTPYHYWHKYISGQAKKEEPTPAMNIGSAVHTLTLEPEHFINDFYIITQKTRPTKGTAPHEKMLAESYGRTILTNEEYSKAQKIANAVLNNVNAKNLIIDSRIENSIFFTHEATGLQCKVRPDSWSGTIVCDLKTSDEASSRSFQNSCVQYGYYLQAGMIQYALNSIDQKLEQFVFIVAEKKEPYAIAIYTLSERALEYGCSQFDKLMQKIYQCIEKGKWPDYGIKDICIPGYVKYDDEIQFELE